jgi:hypothetical protein
MSRSEALYQDAAAFKPERFLVNDGANVTRKYEHPTFGYGKRRVQHIHRVVMNLVQAMSSGSLGRINRFDHSGHAFLGIRREGTLIEGNALYRHRTMVRAIWIPVGLLQFQP